MSAKTERALDRLFDGSARQVLWEAGNLGWRLRGLRGKPLARILRGANERGYYLISTCQKDGYDVAVFQKTG